MLISSFSETLRMCVDLSRPRRSTIPPTDPRDDFTWKPSQGIMFHTPSTPTSGLTKTNPRQASAPSYISLPNSSAIPFDSVTKVRRVDSSGRPLCKSTFRRFSTRATQQHQVTDESRARIGPDPKPDVIIAKNGVEIEKQSLHQQIWWEPVCFDTTGARPVMAEISSKTHTTKRKQSVIPSPGRLEGVTDVSSRRSKPFERPDQMVAISDGKQRKRDRISSEGKVRSTTGRRKRSHSRTTTQQMFTEAGRLVGPENACETLGNENRTIEEHCPLHTESSGRTCSAELTGAVPQLSVRHRRKFEGSQHGPASDRHIIKKRGGIFEPDRRILHGLLAQIYPPTTNAFSRRTRVRKNLDDAEQWTAFEGHSDGTESVAQGKQLSMGYVAFRAPFRRVGTGYMGLLNTLWDAREDCPRLKSLWDYLMIEVADMRDEFLSLSHRYRAVVMVANKSAAIYHGGGLQRTYSSLRCMVRKYYLENPIVEQNEYARQNMRNLFHINNGRFQRGLGIIHGGGRLKDDSKALYEAGQEFVACVKERDGLGKDDLERELDRTLERIRKVVHGLRETLRASRSVVYCWDRFTPSAAPPFSLRRGFYLSMRRLHATRSGLVQAASQVEVAREESLLRQLAKSAVEHTSITSKEAEAPIRSQFSYQADHQTLNIHATAALGNAHFGDIYPVQTIPESLFDVVERPSAVTSAEEQPLIQCSFQIPDELRKRTVAASNSEDTYWQYTLYQGPAGERVKVHYCRNKESSDRIAKLFLDKSVIGFDIEWKPQASAAEGAKKNVSLVQLASEERIALFHIARFGKDGSIDDLVPPNLKKVMETADITKVGVAVKADCTRLRKFMDIESRGLLELSHLYKLIKFSGCDVKKINKSLVSLAQQVEDHLLFPLWKGDVRSSDWSDELNYQQIQCRLFCDNILPND